MTATNNSPTSAEDVALPRTTTERALASVWEDVLGLSPVGRDDRFSELGGTSLLAERALAQVRRRFSLDLTPDLLQGRPTLAQIAARLDTQRTQGFRRRDQAMIRFRSGEPGLPTIACVVGAGSTPVAYLPLLQRLGTEHPVVAFYQRGFIGRGVADHTVGANARRHMASASSHLAKQVILVGHSFGAYVAIEMARLCQRQGIAVERLVLLDPVLRTTEGGSVADFAETAPTRIGRGQQLLTHARIALAGLAQYPVELHQSVFWEIGIRAQNRYCRALFRRGSIDLPPNTELLITDQNQAQAAHWAQLAPTVKQHRVDGDHVEIMSGRRQLDLVEQLVTAPVSPAAATTVDNTGPTT